MDEKPAGGVTVISGEEHPSAATDRPEANGIVIDARRPKKKPEKDARPIPPIENALLTTDLIRALPDPVWLKDPQGTYLLCNDGFERLIGAKEKEIIGKKDDDFFDEPLANLFRQSDRAAIVKRTSVKNEDEVTFADDGRQVTLETVKTPFYADDGRLIGVLGVGRDITKQKQATSKLLNHKLLMNEMGRIAKIGAWEFNPKMGKGTWTDEVAQIYDLDPNENASVEIGMSFFHGKNRTRLEAAIHSAMEEGKAYDLELEMVSAKGVHKWVRTQGRAIVADGRVVQVYGSFQDITERKQTEEELRYHQLLTDEIGRIAKIGGFELDPATEKTTITKEMARILGFPPDLKTDVEMGLNLFPGENRIKLEAAVRAAAAEGKVYDLELEMISAKGEHKWVHTRGVPKMVDGRVVQVIGSVQDITERKRIEEKLRYHKLLMDEIGRIAKIGGWENNPYTGEGTWTDEVARIHDLTPEDEVSVAIGLRFFDDENLARIEAAMRTAVEEGKDWDLELEIISAKGVRKWVHSRGVPKIENGKVVQLYGSFQDITERKQTELELARFRNHLETLVDERTAQLKAANKELESFSYSVSHDLRAPLRAIDGYSRMLLEDFAPDLDSEGQRICGIISKSARDMGRLIDDLLSFSRIGRSKMKPSAVDMTTLAGSIFHELTTPEDRARIDLEIQEMPIAVADPILTRQIWSNLLANAIKFSSRKPRALIRVGAETCDNEVIYRVEDNGAGFDMQYAGKLFGMFQRLHSVRDFEGTGVGLAIVQRILHRHGGRIWAEGAVDRGAAFYFTLKATSSKTAPPSATND